MSGWEGGTQLGIVGRGFKVRVGGQEQSCLGKLKGVGFFSARDQRVPGRAVPACVCGGV